MSNKNQVFQKHKTYRMIINLEQLPEPIFRAIFKYLEYKIILTVLRNVCKKLTEHVDSYVKIMGIFMLTGNNVNPAKVIYIFSKTQKMKSKDCMRELLAVHSGIRARLELPKKRHSI